MTTRARMLALIDAFKDEPPLIREIAARVVHGFEREDAMEDDDMEDEDAALMDALRSQWPEASDEEITRGFNLAVAVAETLKAPLSALLTDHVAFRFASRGRYLFDRTGLNRIRR